MVDAASEVYRDFDRQYECAWNRFLADKRILPENKEAITRFLAHAEAVGLSKARRKIYLDKLPPVAVLLPHGFKEASREDFELIVSKFRKKGYSEWTLHTIASLLRRFYRWLLDLDNDAPLPRSISWFSVPHPPNTIRKEDLLTEEEVAKMVSAAPTLRLKALTAVLYEGALRPGELLTLKVGDVVFNGGTVKLYVRGKMKKKQGDRTVYLMRCFDLLKQHIESLPKDKDALIFIDRNGKAITLANLRARLMKTAKQAGITKTVYPYIFRHSRATILYKELGEALAKQFLGHARDSAMARVYCHLNEADLLEGIEKMYGVQRPEDAKVEPKCSTCGKVYYYGEMFCTACHAPLNMAGAARNEGVQAKLLKLLADPEVVAALEALKANK